MASADNPELVFDHIGIVVKDIDTGSSSLETILGRLDWTDRFDDAGLKVSVRFARDKSGIVYELISPLGEGSPVAGALRARRDLLNQIAFRTSSLEAAAKHLRTTGAVPISKPHPAIAFGGADVQFFLSKLGFLIELIGAPEHSHTFKIRNL